MAGMDKYRHSSTKRVKVKICGQLPSSDQILTRYEVSCLLVLRLLDYASSKRRRRKTWTKWDNLAKSGILSERFGTQLSFFVKCCAVKLKLKVRTLYQNVYIGRIQI